MNLDIKIINSELSITCFFEKSFIKKTFNNSFSLETLKTQSNIFRVFTSVEQILHEIINKKTNEKDYIIGNEENSNIIELIIPIPLNVNNKMSFILNEEVKTTDQSLNEYISAINKFEYLNRIKDFNSEILFGLNFEQSAIKSWISPFERIEAELLYSFHSFTYIDNKNQKIYYNPGYDSKVSDFHNTCDFRRNILIICKSKNEIFGGYTPLSFNDSDGYEKDNNSFLFSLNKKNKYGKKTRNFSNSIFHNKNNGPCFCRDLFFIENSMNRVKFGKDELFAIEEYSTEKNWVNKQNCNAYNDYIILDALEIFQIVKRQYDFNEVNNDINNNQNNINNSNINHSNQVNNNNRINRRIQNNANNSNINHNSQVNNNNLNRSIQNNANHNIINNQSQTNNNNNNNNDQDNVNNNNLDNRNNTVNNNIITDNNNANNNNHHNNSFESGNLSFITQISDNDNNSINQDNIFDFNNITIENNANTQEADQNLIAIEENRINNAKGQNNTFCSFKRRLNISSSQNTS